VDDLETKQIKSALLVFLEGENQGSEIRVNPPRTLEVGRSEECDIFLGEKKISRKHCRIIVENDQVILEDLQSTNGTMLNKKQAKDKNEIFSEDLVQVGTSLIKITIEYQAQVSPQTENRKAEISAPAPKPIEEKDLKTDFEASSGVMSIVDESSQSMGMSALTREQKNISSQPMERKPLMSNPSEKKPKTLSGDLSAMGLADLLQNLSQNNKSGDLSLNNKLGEVYIVEGKVVGAKTGNVQGRKALYRMLSWREGEFELLPLEEKFKASEVEQPIDDNIENLLMEGFRQFDEIEKMQKKLPPLGARLRLRSNLEAPLSRLHPKVLDVLQLVMNKGTFQAVLDQADDSDLEVSKMIYYLLKKEYIEIEA